MKGSCIEIQVYVHLARLLQPYQVKFLPLAEAKGVLVRAQGAHTEGAWDAKVGVLNDAERNEKCRRNKHRFVSSAGRKYILESPSLHFPNHPSGQWRKGNAESIGKKPSCGFGTVAFQLVLPLDSG